MMHGGCKYSYKSITSLDIESLSRVAYHRDIMNNINSASAATLANATTSRAALIRHFSSRLCQAVLLRSRRAEKGGQL